MRVYVVMFCSDVRKDPSGNRAFKSRYKRRYEDKKEERCDQEEGPEWKGTKMPSTGGGLLNFLSDYYAFEHPQDQSGFVSVEAAGRRAQIPSLAVVRCRPL